jgi:hypothetical protein
MAGDIATRATHATDRLDAALAESDGSVVVPITGLTYRIRVPTALTVRTRGICSMAVAVSTVVAVFMAVEC